MKYFLIIASLIFMQKLLAQDPQLFENTWYLQNLIINGHDNFPPSNEEVEFVDLFFDENPGFNMATNVCNSAGGEIVFDNENSNFLIPEGLSVTLIGCGNQVNEDFELLYFNFYMQTTNSPYNYLLEQNGNDLQLSVTNSNSDTAIYSNVLLSVKDNQQLAVKIYPNPTTGHFKVQLEEGLLYAIEVYDITGKVVKTVYDYRNNEEIDISARRSGVYFLKISNTHGSYKMLKLNKI